MKLQIMVQGDVLMPNDKDSYDYVENLKPNSVHWVEIKHCSKKDLRSLAQNRMQFRWFKDLSLQGDMTAIEYRAYSKLHFGVPLLRVVDETFREQYDTIIKPLEYEQKLNLMCGAIDLPITSRMDVETMALYLKAISDHFLAEGFELTTFENLTEWMARDKSK